MLCSTDWRARLSAQLLLTHVFLLLFCYCLQLHQFPKTITAFSYYSVNLSSRASVVMSGLMPAIGGNKQQAHGTGCDTQLAQYNYVNKMTYKPSKLGRSDLAVV